MDHAVGWVFVVQPISSFLGSVFFEFCVAVKIALQLLYLFLCFRFMWLLIVAHRRQDNSFPNLLFKTPLLFLHSSLCAAVAMLYISGKFLQFMLRPPSSEAVDVEEMEFRRRRM